jgi:hypothetical protein
MRVLFNVTFCKYGSEYTVDRGDGVDSPGFTRDKVAASLWSVVNHNHVDPKIIVSSIIY